MNRHMLQHYWSKLFASKVRPDQQRPIKSVKYTEMDELVNLAYSVLDRKKANEFRVLFNQIKSDVWNKLKEEDAKLLEQMRTKVQDVAVVDEEARQTWKRNRYFRAYGGVPNYRPSRSSSQELNFPTANMKFDIEEYELRKLLLEF